MKKLKLMAVLSILCICFAGCSKKVENKEMTISILDQKLKGKFTGTLEDKKPEGKGSFVYKKDKEYLTYKGEFSKGKPSGKGSLKTNMVKVKLSDTDTTGVYEGEISDGKLNGSGKYKVLTPSDTKSSYSGYWKNNLPDGQGELIFDQKGYLKQSGTFTKGYFTPNILELFNTLGTDPSLNFSVSYKAQEFLSDHEDLFPAKNLKQIKNLTDSSIKYKQFFQHPDQYGDKLVRLSNYYIVQLDSYSAYGYNINEIILVDSSLKQICVVIYPDELEHIYESDTVDVYGIPIDRSSYENKNGGTAKTCIIAGSYFKKVK